MYFFIIGQLNINHKVLKEGTKGTENDRIICLNWDFLGLKDFGNNQLEICCSDFFQG